MLVRPHKEKDAYMASYKAKTAMHSVENDNLTKITFGIDFETGAHTGANKEFLHTVYAPFYGSPSVYALVSRMVARIAEKGGGVI